MGSLMSDDSTQNNASLDLTIDEIAVIRGDLPALLTSEEAAELAGVPIKTLYHWSSAGRLKGFTRKRGKRLAIVTDRFIKEIFNGQEW
jgi:hypothetical protein